MESRISMIHDLHKKTGMGLYQCKHYLQLANYEMDLAVEIAEYYGIAVNKSYPVGRIIRDYWMAKAREEYW